MSDDCCGPVTTAPPPADACCGDSAPAAPGGTLELEDRTPWWRDRSLALPLAAGALWVTGLLLGWAGLELAGLVVHALALAAGAWTFVPGTVTRLVRGRGLARLGVGLLMTLAALGAVLLGHVGEAAALAFLFSLAEALEDRSMDRAKQGLRSLLALLPETVRVSRAAGPELVPAAELRTGDVLLLGAGDRVATDGVIVEGRSWLDTSAITGESIPVEAGPGDEVHAGSLNGSGSLSLRATADGRDNSLTQIVRLVDQAHAAKGERARLADRIARPLVPVVLVVSALVALVGLVTGEPGTWIERALVVLVAASPCAMAIAVPVTVISSIGAASRFGVVIKSGAAFEQLGTIRTVALDKTGTLTRNEPQVVEVATAEGRRREEIIALAAALESSSSHPLAGAVLAAADATGEDAAQAAEVQESPGHGLTGQIAGRAIRVGSPRWIAPGPLATRTEDMAARGMSLIVVEEDGRVIGALGVRDELRPEAASTVAALHAQGIRTVMLTGDHALTARAIAEEAGIDEVHAEQLPADKAAHVRRLAAQAPTAMVGDGINDAPALASATVGIAIGVTGTAAAVESADVVFTGTELEQLPGALAHARRGRRIMTGNIALALAIIVVLFPLALFGVLGLAAVVLIHEAAEVVVIANGMRAARAGGGDRGRSGIGTRSGAAQGSRVPVG
ncbi:cadmium-translocating P-type ATPase [Brachybacterium vulturis]|uniref:Cadmium-translocating P-type ATPase n=1 Tax=Brachybacterium vulturis TaxID=2017484 RepID=A0A291GIX9_9MICO|nr:cation-translocating P-type ATPase [Brachybacterium vulturis]ATG50138.1 cadmium-translocating P-type ATPase [Brachybacterium vulturis]